MLKQSTKQLLESFRWWNIYDPRTNKDKADHLRYCRSVFGNKDSRERHIQLLVLRRQKGSTFISEVLVEAGYDISSPENGIAKE